MKIAYFINQYPQVSHSFIRREILALERQGFEVLRVALRGWDGPLPDEEDQRERRKTLHALRGPFGLVLATAGTLLRSPRRFCSALRAAVRMSRDSIRPLYYHLIYVAEACRLVQWLIGFGAERLHAHFGTNSAEIALLARILGGPPYSFTVHGPEEFTRPMNLDEKISRAAFVVAISDFGRSQLYMRSQFSDWPKVKVVHCGVERNFYEDAVVPPVPSTPRLVCVGRLCSQKGQLLLVEAAARLLARNVPFELVLAGDGPMRGELETLIRQHGLGQRVRITGWISSSDVRREILASRAMVLPSFAEGLPVVIMEAMALKRPVLSTYVAGIPELVRSGETGWLFPAGSVDDLAQAMEDCLATPAGTLQAMGEAAQKRVIARHSIDTEATKLAKLFHTCIEPPIEARYGQAQPARQS